MDLIDFATLGLSPQTPNLSILAVCFWAAVLLLAHTYVGYPILLRFLGGRKELPEDRFESDEEFPEVAVLMAVYNEEAVLERTLESIFSSDYPKGKLRVYLGSDGSTDASHEIVERFQAEYPELTLRVFSGRNGKIRIINQLAEDARGAEAFVLCDANVAWSTKLLRNLVRHFKRPDVGLVGANVRDAADERAGIGDEENAYIDQENQTKYLEGVLWGNMMGAFGACYAMRAELFRPVPNHFIVDDFFLTMKCLEADRKAIVDPDAVCFESVSTEISEEFRRKKRIATGNFQNLGHFPMLQFPHLGKWSTWFAFWSHKGLRWIGPLLLITAILTSVFLSVFNPFYLAAVAGFAASFLFYIIDAALAGSGQHIRLFRFVRYFYSMNAAVFLGFLEYVRGGRSSVWEPTKRVLTKTQPTIE